MILGGVAGGLAVWLAARQNVFPAESVRVYELARDGKMDEARALYDWFLPLLRLDTVPKFVQLIKLVQEEVGMGNARVRAPRLELVDTELEEALKVIRATLGSKPKSC